MTLKALYLQTGAYNALDDRMLAGMLLDLSADPLSGNGRVISGMTVSAQATPNMTVLVSPGRAVCPTPASDGGGYAIMNDANATITVSPVSTLPRVDIVLLACDDADYSGATYAPKIYIVAGTPAASPTAPAQPAGTTLLATLNHLANATSVPQSAIVRYNAGNLHEVEYYATAIQSIVQNGDRPVQYAVAKVPGPDVTIGTATTGAVTNARFQLNRSGLCTIDASCRLVGADAMQAGVWIGPDTGGTRWGSSLNAQGGTSNPEMSASVTRRFTAGDFVVVYAYQNSAAAKNTDPFNESVHFRASWIRP